MIDAERRSVGEDRVEVLEQDAVLREVGVAGEVRVDFVGGGAGDRGGNGGGLG